MVQRVIHLQKNDVGRMSRFISHLNEVHNPVFFHDVNGNTYCIIHGRKEETQLHIAYKNTGTICTR